jgi:hypothetical protein
MCFYSESAQPKNEFSLNPKGQTLASHCSVNYLGVRQFMPANMYIKILFPPLALSHSPRVYIYLFQINHSAAAISANGESVPCLFF